MDKFDFIDQALKERDAKGQRRRLRSVSPVSGPVIQVDGRDLVNFCSNDYLGLAQHPMLRERSAAFMARYGNGATASRLVCGNLFCFEQLEKKLAALKGTETALVLNAGYQANVSLIPTLADRNALILSDALNHNSLIMGTRLARCHTLTFRHNDMDHLGQLLKENHAKGFSRILIVTESVFSMDGDQSDIDALVRLSQSFGALLYLDEAHATGVLGPNGMGLSCGRPVDIVMGTFSKGCGAFGAYVACAYKVRDYLVNCCPGLIYSTGLPPGVLGAIDAALDLVPGMAAERQQLHRHANEIRAQLQSLGWHTGDSSTQIIPLILGGENDTLSLSGWLENEGILATAIRPPTVPNGESRIRLTVSALHTKAHIDYLMGALSSWKGVPRT